MIPNHLPQQIADVYSRISDIERRVRNRRRTGTVKEFDASTGKYRVLLSEQNGTEYLSPWIGARTLGAGNTKIDVVYAVGEQVDVISENGDLTDAQLDMGTYSESNARENGSNTPLHIKIGSTVIEASGSGAKITAGGVTMEITGGGVAITGGQVTHNGKNIGDTHTHTLVTPGGGESGPPP